MKEAASVFLRADIQREDGRRLAGWMGNQNVTRYLNEKSGVSEEICSLLERAPEGMLSYHFNRHGRFFLICDSGGRSIGFIKLAPCSETGCEVVYAIGEELLWGRGYGRRALDLALQKAFFELRRETVEARIRRENTRSIRAAAHCGMRRVQEIGPLQVYRITAREYMESKRPGRSSAGR